MRLSDYDAGVLRFEAQHWRDGATKDAAIRELFGITPVRYYQHLARLLEQPAAVAAEPVLMYRLRRIRHRRARAHRRRSKPGEGSRNHEPETPGHRRG